MYSDHKKELLPVSEAAVGAQGLSASTLQTRVRITQRPDRAEGVSRGATGELCPGSRAARRASGQRNHRGGLLLCARAVCFLECPLWLY